MSVVDQKEYLKKYLGIGKRSKEKKGKKKSKKAPSRFKIVDDDDVEFRLNEEIKQDLDGENEDAPQIVSVIDDRPPSLRIDEDSKVKLWKPLGAPEIIPDTDKPLKFEGNLCLGKPKAVRGNKSARYSSSKSRVDSGHLSPSGGPKDADVSPQRSSRKLSHQDYSPPRKIKREKSEDMSPPRVQYRDPDCSPPRRIKKEKSDTPPPQQKDSRCSPSGRNKRDRSKDNSPPRPSRDPHCSPRRLTRDGSKDISPPRRAKKENSIDNSPPRRSRKQVRSPPRKTREDKGKKSRWADVEEEGEKLKKTLDGKTAGLQNAAELVRESQELKEREDALFKNMSSEMSGANAATVVRGKKKEVDWEEEERKRLKQAENKEKYDRWGKGVKQVEDASERLKNELYEMSKPLARYADDEDLEKYLKDQEREGDPMLLYLRQKKKSKARDEGKPMLQQYQGDAAPNRFGIRPGYRWDGVDRSNGYEKEWFQVQNSRTASVEEIYKWSTEDM